MKDIVLEAECLTKRYSENMALNNLNVKLRRGEIYGLIGKNGAGKTTFLKLITEQIQPTEGQLRLFGENSWSGNRRLGALIESPGFYKDMSAKDNLSIKCGYCGIKRPGYEQKLLELVGLGEVGNKKAGKFSLGMKQRLGIALALVGEPDLLILDEPTNGMDPDGIVEFREMIIRLNREYDMTIIISSHILDELAKFATKFGIIKKGRLVKEITVDELEEACREGIEVTTPSPGKVATLLEQKLGITKFKLKDNELLEIWHEGLETKDLTALLSREGVSFDTVSYRHRSLEEYYMEYAGGAENA